LSSFKKQLARKSYAKGLCVCVSVRQENKKNVLLFSHVFKKTKKVKN
jgi:hypothetical protein